MPSFDPIEILGRAGFVLVPIALAWCWQIREWRRQKRVRQHLNGSALPTKENEL